MARARASILLIDNWVGVETLDLLAKKRKGVPVTVVTSEHKDRNGKPRSTLATMDCVNGNGGDEIWYNTNICSTVQRVQSENNELKLSA